jgi:hypothetical protein
MHDASDISKEINLRTRESYVERFSLKLVCYDTISEDSIGSLG